MNIINDLPNVADLIEAESIKKSVDSNIHQQKTTSNQSEILEMKVTAPEPPPIPINIPPPPPPPAIPQNFIPAPPPAPTSPAPIQSFASEPKLPQPSSDPRSSLMEAIRNAGGKSKLRSVPAADEEVPLTKKKPQAAPAGDLMSDLHAKLALRRRGIAGSKEAKKEKASLMEKVSSLIPPPSKRAESDDESSNTDTDWE